MSAPDTTHVPTATLAVTAEASLAARSLRLALLALSMGGFAIGTTEFVTMGLLPQVARGVEVGIPTAGHAISAYALGVVVGAPVIAFLAAKLPRRGLLVGLMAAFVLGNAASALAPSYGSLVLARFVSGLPHGAYFGVASLVAASLVRQDRRGRAVSLVMIGLAIANIAGVPAATLLGQHLGWRSAYWSVAALGVVTVLLLLLFVPARAGDPAATGRREMGAFREPQVWLTALVGAVGFGGMFSVYSYIAPTITQVGGLPEGAVPVYLLVFGVGMTAGTWLGGVLADRSVFRAMLGSMLAMAALLALFAPAAATGWWSLPVLLGISISGSVLVVNLQMRLMRVAGAAQTLGAALNHASLNLANALGAWLGGLVIAAGFGYASTALVGAALSLGGLGFLAASVVVHRRTA